MTLLTRTSFQMVFFSTLAAYGWHHMESDPASGLLMFATGSISILFYGYMWQCEFSIAKGAGDGSLLDRIDQAHRLVASLDETVRTMMHPKDSIFGRLLENEVSRTMIAIGYLALFFAILAVGPAWWLGHREASGKSEFLVADGLDHMVALRRYGDVIVATRLTDSARLACGGFRLVQLTEPVIWIRQSVGPPDATDLCE